MEAQSVIESQEVEDEFAELNQSIEDTVPLPKSRSVKRKSTMSRPRPKAKQRKSKSAVYKKKEEQDLESITV